MGRKRRRNSFQAGELNLTAMIDVAFQLLAFFILTAKPVDVVTNLDVFRPQADSITQNSTPPKVIRVTVFPDGFTINDRAVDSRGLNTLLSKLADLDKTQTILIQCLNDSPHGKLIELLDLCSKLKLTNLSVVSSGGA
ncbi:MAG: biopolymer transporter ExbD [bacterium]|jgi:biopolymer transport protein ExbD